MKTWTNPASIWLVSCCVLAVPRTARPAAPRPPLDAVALQAIEHARDPSGVAAAFANGIALDRSDPKLYAAYVARMVELGLPELAYRQAQALTILQPGNGLALGVIACVDARRGRMAEAITDINLAGQFAPENTFVAHTAGELLAWYDVKADQTTLTERDQQGVERLRALLAKQMAFSGAYEAACKGYRAQAGAELPPAQAAPGQYAPFAQNRPAPPGPAPQPALQGGLGAPLGYAAPAGGLPYYPYPAYYPYPPYSDSFSDWAPQFSEDWGPGWEAPAPETVVLFGESGYGGWPWQTGAGERDRGWTTASRASGVGRIHYDFNYVAPPGREPLAPYRQAPAFGGFQAPAFGGSQAPAFGGSQAPAFESPGGNREGSIEGGGHGSAARRVGHGGRHAGGGHR